MPHPILAQRLDRRPVLRETLQGLKELRSDVFPQLCGVGQGKTPAWPGDEAGRVVLVDRELELEAFGDCPPPGPWELPQTLRYEIALCDFETRLICAALVEAVVTMNAPEGSAVLALENQLWAAGAAYPGTFRDFRANLRLQALGQFQTELVDRVRRGQFQPDSRIFGYLKGYLFGESRGYEKVLREELETRRGSLSGPRQHPLEVVDAFGAEPEGAPDGQVGEISPRDLLELNLASELDVLDDLIADPKSGGQAATATKRDFVTRSWRAFLHGIVRDARDDTDLLSFSGSSAGLLGASKSLARLERDDPDRFALEIEAMRGFVWQRRCFLAGIACGGDEDETARLRALRSGFGQRIIHHPESLRRDFLPWLTVALVGREWPHLAADPPYRDLSPEQVKQVQDQANNLKGHLLPRTIENELKARGLDPDEFPFIFGSLTRSQS
jgi:hypothetical protein